MAASNLNNRFLEAFKSRRSYYALQKYSTVTDDQLEEIVKEIITASPTSFNCQNTRVVILLRSEHDFLWNNIVWDALRPYVAGNAQAEAHTSERLANFADSHGTVLFFNDPSASAPLAANTPAYSKQVPQWDEQSMGMLQIAIWVALEAENMGCNLQHYNPIIDDEVKKRWNLPEYWVLKAQMVFGRLKDGEKRKGWLEEKEVQAMSERLFVCGKD